MLVFNEFKSLSGSCFNIIGEGDASKTETSNVTSSGNKQEATSETKPPVKKEKENELEKYWKPVKENPGDFTGWTYLLQFVEQEVISCINFSY